ncbi:hypothetical protein, partial [Nitrosomonas sp. Nm84]|uniref:hypothetical protein n=1 Tax=Nitrosomonas sp. Nm84 TaxID=200124 RepID=UPI0015E8B78E
PGVVGGSINKPGRDAAVTKGTLDISKVPLPGLAAAAAGAAGAAGVVAAGAFVSAGFAGAGLVACAWKAKHMPPIQQQKR